MKKNLEDKIIGISNNFDSNIKSSNNIGRRDFLKKLENFGKWGLFLYASSSSETGCKFCKKNPIIDDSINGYKNASLYIADFYQNPVTGGSVETDKGSYSITNGVSNVEYDNSLRCTINVPGNVKREANITNEKNYILVPSEWEAFFAHHNIGGDGTNKFNSTIQTYIDGLASDPDYETVKQRLAISGSGRANNLVDNISDANFIIHLNSNRNGHAESHSNGLISDCDIYLKNSTDQFYTLEIAADEEIAQGLTHTGDCYLNPPEGNDSCIAGYHKGWQPIDKNIMDALYNRNRSTFFGNGTEREP